VKKSRRGIKLAKNTICFKVKHRKTIGCFFDSIICLYQSKLKQLKKQNLKDIREKEMHTSSLYWFTLTTRATSSSQKPLGNPLSNQTRLQTPHTKIVTLNPSRNTLPLANHTKSIHLEHLNTQHSLAVQQQKYRRLRKGLHLIKVQLKRIQLQSYSTLT